MQLKHETIAKENSQLLLKITVNKEEVKNEYDKLLKETQKSAQIKGFRKGKVPISILETKFKQGFLADTANTIIENAYKEVLDKLEDSQKPIHSSMPQLENFTPPTLTEDYTFELIYDVLPEIKIDDYKTLEIEKNDVEVTDKDLQNELDRRLSEFATIEPKDKAIEDGDIVTIDCEVTHEGNEFHKKENEQIYIGKDFDTFKLSKDITGMKKGDEKEFDKTFGDEEIEKIKGKTLTFKIKINEVKQEVKPELNDELAEQIDENCKTVDELKEKIKTSLNEYADGMVKNKVITAAMDKLVETFEGEIPQSMLDSQQNLYFSEFVKRFAGDEKRALSILKKQGMTKEEYLDKYKDEALAEIKKGLILQEVIKTEDIQIEDEDRKKFLEPHAKQYKMEIDQLLTTFKSGGQMEYFDNQIRTQKAFDCLYDGIKKTEGKKVTLEELYKG